MIFRVHRNYHYTSVKKAEESKESDDLANTINLKILDAILEDDDDQFSQLLSENTQDPSKSNKTFKITNFKLPNILKGNPSYASLCAFFSAENCFTALSLFQPDGTSSDQMKKLDDFKRSPIHFACIGGSLNILRELDQCMFDLNAQDESGYLPSHYAAMAGHFDIIKYLWTKGANLTSPSIDNKMTPLQLACFYGHLDIVQFICENVIITDSIENSEGKLNGSPNFLRNFLSIGKEPTPLHCACKGGHDNIVNYFISKPELIEIQLNSLDKNSRNPLLCACHNGSLNCVKALLNNVGNKIKLNMKGRKHLPLVDAAAGGYLDIVQFLLKQKKIKIQQETSENISPLHAAVLNDHLNVVKFLIQNGASQNISKDKIGHIFLAAIQVENLKLVSYLDNVLQIPYNEKYKVEQTTKRSSYYYRRLVLENESKNLNYSDFFIQQACQLENKEIVQFLLDKKCSLDFVDISQIINEKSTDFIQFLIEKGFDLSCSKNPSIKPPIVKLIHIGNINLIEKYISLGAVLNAEIILKYRLLENSLSFYNYKLFEYLLNYKPELKKDDSISLFDTVFYHNIQRIMIRSYANCYNAMEALLKNYDIDLNSPFKEFYKGSYISIAAEKKDLKLLKLFANYGADFKNCKLKFESMVTFDYIQIYNFLKENGCKFDKRIIVKKALDSEKEHLCPLHKIFWTLAQKSNFDYNVIVFMLDFSTPQQIINARYNGYNLIDFFMNRKCYDGIAKAYTVVGKIFYPLLRSIDLFNQWVISSNNPNLINIVLNSGLQIVKADEEIEYDISDSDSDSGAFSSFSYSDF